MAHQIAAIFQEPEKIFEGEFRLSAYVLRMSSTGKRFIKLTIEDATGSIDGYIWGEHKGLTQWDDLEAVRAEGSARRFGDGVVVDITRLGDMWLDDPCCAARLLPRRLCADPCALDRLVVVVDEIEDNLLRTFCNNVFDDLSIAIPFLQVPASREHHHAQPGGLLRHSIEVAENVCHDDSLMRTERDIAIVGALFHDAGKIRTLNSDYQNTLYLDHDLLTLEIVANALRKLDKTAPRLSHELRHIWTFRRTHSKTGPLTAAAHAVLNADRQSVGADVGITSAEQNIKKNNSHVVTLTTV